MHACLCWWNKKRLYCMIDTLDYMYNWHYIQFSHLFILQNAHELIFTFINQYLLCKLIHRHMQNFPYYRIKYQQKLTHHVDSNSVLLVYIFLEFPFTSIWDELYKSCKASITQSLIDDIHLFLWIKYWQRLQCIFDTTCCALRC